MGKTLLQAAFSDGVASTANTVQYWKLGGKVRTDIEASSAVIFRSTGILSGLLVKLSANSVNGTSTFVLRKNATTDLNNTVSVGANATGDFEDTTNTDSISAADKVVMKTTPGAATGTYTITMMSLVFDATTNTITKLVSGTSQSFTAASTTTFMGLHGDSAATATEGDVKARMRKAGTFKNMAILVNTARATTTTGRLRKDGGNGNAAVSCTGGVTGWFEDISSSDTVAAGEDWNYSITTGTGVDTFNTRAIQVEFESTASNGILMAQTEGTITVTDNTNRFFFISGNLRVDTSETTAAGVQTKARVAFTCSELTCLITQNDVSSASTLMFRVDAADTALTASITGNTTGVFSDSTHSVTLTTTSQINTQITVPAVSGTHTITVKNILVYTAANIAVTKTLATETVTISEASLTRLCAKIRTGGTQTVTVGESAVRLAAKNRVLGTETVTSNGGSLDRVKGSVKTASDTITVGAGTLARLVNKIRTLSDTTTIGESIARMCAKIRSFVVSSYSVLLDGDNDRIDLGDESSLWSQSKNKFSFSCWVYINSNQVADPAYILDHNYQSALNGAFTIYYVINDAFYIDVKDGTDDGGGFTAAAFDDIKDSWVHIIGTVDTTQAEADQVRVYVDGSTDAQTYGGTGVSAIDGNGNLYLGNNTDNNSGVMGNVKDFRWWNEKILNSTERTDVMNNDPAAPAPDYWLPMEEGTGNPVDSISGTLEGTLENGATWEQNSPTVWPGSGGETVVIDDTLDKQKGKVRILDETLIISDSVSRLAAKIRTLIESPSTSESLNRLAAKTRSLATEDSTIDDTLNRTKGAVRTLQEDTTIGETLARLCNKIRTAIETTIIGESLTRLCNKIRTLGTETVTSSENVARVKSANRTLSTETTVISEQIARLCAKIRTASDTVISSETLNRMKASMRSLATETVTIGDSVARLVSKTRTIIENTSIGESLNRLCTKMRSLAAETVTVGESVARMCAKIRTLTTEVVAIADLVEQVVVQGGGNAIERIIEETIVIGDSVTRLAEKIRTVVETVDSTEDIARMKAANRSLSESESISDSVARLCNKIRTTIENTTVGESLTRLANKFRLLSETVVSGENVVRQSGKSRSLSESESIGESIARMCAKIRNPIETESIGEALNRMTEKFRTISESVTVNDTAARVKGVMRSLSDSITIGAGTVANMSAKIRVCIETVVSSEQLVRQCNKFRTFVETVVINDLATALKQGPITVHLILTETVLVADMLSRFVRHIGIRPLGAGAGGRRMKRLVRRNFRLFK